MDKFVKHSLIVAVTLLLNACVTQNFEKDVPVIENTASNKELAMTRISLGLGYLKMGNNTQAKFNLEKAKKFGPNLVEVYAAFAHYYETVDEPELTIKAYEKALSIRKNDANTLNNYGVYLCRKKEYEASEKLILKAIAVPSYLLVAESYENLASCQLSNGNFDKGQQYLAKSIAHSPNRSSALFQMIRLEYAMGNYKRARRYNQKFEKVTRRFKPESLALSFKVYQKLGDQKISRNYGAMLVNMYPKSWEAQQYVLNGLVRVEADELAEKYQASKTKSNKNEKKKRVVFLSPNKKSQPYQAKKPVSTTPPVKVDTKVIEPESEIIAETTAKPIAKTVAVEKSEILTEEPQQLEESQVVTSESIIDKEAENLSDSTAENLSDNTAENSTDKTDAGILTASDEVEALDSNPEQNVEPTDELFVEFIDDQSSTDHHADLDTVVEASSEPTFHMVEKGDNLYLISVKYNIRLSTILRWNGLTESSKIKIGDKILLVEPIANLDTTPEVDLNENE